MYKPAFPILLIALILVACGGGANDSEELAIGKYEPDFSTPEGVSEAYAQAAEGYDLELMNEVIHPDEREAELERVKAAFEKNETDGVGMRVEYPKANLVSDVEAHALMHTSFIRDGEESSRAREFWVVFVKEDDRWYYSPGRSETLNQMIAEQARRDSETDGGELPPADDSQADGTAD